MRTSLESLETVPVNELCAQIGSENFRELSLLEILEMSRMIRKCLDPEEYGCKLRVVWNSHDFGSYPTIEIFGNDESDKCWGYVEYVMENVPMEWDSEARENLKANGYFVTEGGQIELRKELAL